MNSWIKDEKLISKQSNQRSLESRCSRAQLRCWSWGLPGETSSSETERRHRKRLEAVLQMLSIRFLIKRDQMKGNPSLSLSQVVGETPVNLNVEVLKQAERWYTCKFKEGKRSQAHFISDHWELEEMVDDSLTEDIKEEPFESYQLVWSFGFVMGNNICEKNQSDINEKTNPQVTIFSWMCLGILYRNKPISDWWWQIETLCGSLHKGSTL